MSRLHTTSPRNQASRRPSPVNSPRSLASTPRRAASSRKAGILSGGTAKDMRSWASETKISQGSRPAYLSGALSRWILQPPDSRAISPRDEDRPPAPLSVTKR